MDGEMNMRAAHMMMEAAREMRQAADTMDRVWNEMRSSISPGYGSPLEQLIDELRDLKQMIATIPPQ